LTVVTQDAVSVEIYDRYWYKTVKLPLTVIILTHNEEQNIEMCLQSVLGWVADIVIVDSHSTDKTIDILNKYTNRVFQHQFENHARQFNWALSNVSITTEWIMRLDADEVVTPKLRGELLQMLPELAPTITGCYVKRRVHFMGRWIRHGGYYPIWLLRLWRNGKGLCEERWMDEHIKLASGETIRCKYDIIDDNAKNLHWWIGKHNGYATREMADLLRIVYSMAGDIEITPKLLGTQEQRKRWFKMRYARLPLFIRPFLYFFYRYIIRAGFLDGKEGLVWHFLQGFWYRFLVDAKIFELRKKGGTDRATIETLLIKEYGRSFL
jgi:glycosyltransferase involved in cell wall biosynthesis